MKRRRPFSRESPAQRRLDLIKATLDLIGEAGVPAATTRAIAARADVTLGLIRHHFSTKEDLLTAAYEHHMSEMTLRALAPAKGEGSAKFRLASVIQANLTAPVLSETNVTIWASFISQIANEPNFRATHSATYLAFRDQLEALIKEALEEEGKQPPPHETRQLATVANAIIDGLWMEGGATPSEFKAGELAEIAIDKIGLILGLNLRI